jgi:hypothetical protein
MALMHEYSAAQIALCTKFAIAQIVSAKAQFHSMMLIKFLLKSM